MCYEKLTKIQKSDAVTYEKDLLLWNLIHYPEIPADPLLLEFKALISSAYNLAHMELLVKNNHRLEKVIDYVALRMAQEVK